MDDARADALRRALGERKRDRKAGSGARRDLRQDTAYLTREPRRMERENEK